MDGKKVALLLISLFLLITGCDLSRFSTFSGILVTVESMPPEKRQELLDQLMPQFQEYPIVESDTIVYFIARGQFDSLFVSGDFNEYSSAQDRLSNLEGTDLWYCRKTFPRDARFDYLFVHNGSEWKLDPLNNRQMYSGYGPKSDLRMPGFIPNPVENLVGKIAHGQLIDDKIESKFLGEKRDVRVYLPPGYNDSGSTKYRVMVFHDGMEFDTVAYTTKTIDFLIANNKIKPFIALFTPPVKRTAEYAGRHFIGYEGHTPPDVSLQNEYVRFITIEVMEYLKERYPISDEQGTHAIMGASFGGNISLVIGLNHPEIFGHVAAFSTAVQPNLTGLVKSTKIPVQIYMTMGNYDLERLIPPYRDFERLLIKEGYDVESVWVNDGHTWGHWRSLQTYPIEKFFGVDL